MRSENVSEMVQVLQYIHTQFYWVRDELNYTIPIPIESVPIYVFRTYSSTNWLFYSNRNGIRKHIPFIEITLASATYSNSMASLSFYGMQPICRWNWVVNIVTFRWNSGFFRFRCNSHFSLAQFIATTALDDLQYAHGKTKSCLLHISLHVSCIRFTWKCDSFSFFFLFSSSCIVPIELFLNVWRVSFQEPALASISHAIDSCCRWNDNSNVSINSVCFMKRWFVPRRFRARALLFLLVAMNCKEKVRRFQVMHSTTQHIRLRNDLDVEMEFPLAHFVYLHFCQSVHVRNELFISTPNEIYYM